MFPEEEKPKYPSKFLDSIVLEKSYDGKVYWNLSLVFPTLKFSYCVIEELKTFLEETTRVKQLERQNQEAQLTQETFYKVPYPIYIG